MTSQRILSCGIRRQWRREIGRTVRLAEKVDGCLASCEEQDLARLDLRRAVEQLHEG
jgi:hypothetical protein